MFTIQAHARPCPVQDESVGTMTDKSTQNVHCVAKIYPDILLRNACTTNNLFEDRKAKISYSMIRTETTNSCITHVCTHDTQVIVNMILRFFRCGTSKQVRTYVRAYVRRPGVLDPPKVN